MEKSPTEEKNIKIHVYFSHNYVESELILKDKTVVVIDVLRSSTTMCAGLFNGAKEIIPAVDVATAGLIGRNSAGQSLLCGERNGRIIEGFNLGNSVKEYSREVVNGKTLIFSSTNGTPAMMKSKFSRTCIICSFANLNRVADYLEQLNENFVILCSGKQNEPSIEDSVCAGMLINNIIKTAPTKFELSDSALITYRLFTCYKKDLLKMLQESEHGKFLSEIGFEDDLAACSQVDQFPVLPLMRNNLIRTLEGFETDPKLTMKKVVKQSPGS
jgi:2-phosphosulfolactate phosphatase